MSSLGFFCNFVWFGFNIIDVWLVREKFETRSWLHYCSVVGILVHINMKLSIAYPPSTTISLRTRLPISSNWTQVIIIWVGLYHRFSNWRNLAIWGHASRACSLFMLNPRVWQRNFSAWKQAEGVYERRKIRTGSACECQLHTFS